MHISCYRYMMSWCGRWTQHSSQMSEVSCHVRSQERVHKTQFLVQSCPIFLRTALYACLCPFAGGWKFINVRLGVTILIVVRILISEWNLKEYIKIGLGYTKFSQIIVSIVLAYLRINIYANLKLVLRSSCTYTNMCNPSLRNQHFAPKFWSITNLFFLSRVFATWGHHQGDHRKFEVEITDM